MNITIYKNTSADNYLTKNLTTLATLTNVKLLDDCSILYPKFILRNENNILTANYLYVPSFSRYYFITNITILDATRILLECKIDVLYTYKTEILNLTCTIKRSQYYYNLYLDDPLFLAENNPQIITKNISSNVFKPSALSGATCFVLTVVGG